MSEAAITPLSIHQKDGAPAAPAAPAKHKEKAPAQKPDAYLVAWMLIVESCQISTDTAETYAKQIENSAATQSLLIHEQSQIYLKTLPNTNLNSNQLEQFETQNQLASAQRGIIGSQLTDEQQNVSILETNLGTKLNGNNQSQQEAASVPQMMLNLANRIAQI